MFGIRANIDPPTLADDGLPDEDDSEEDIYRASIMPNAMLLEGESYFTEVFVKGFGEEAAVEESDGDLDEPRDITLDKEMDQDEEDINVVPVLNPEVPMEHPLDEIHGSDVPFDKTFLLRNLLILQSLLEGIENTMLYLTLTLRSKAKR
ncbi:hypothetical protein R1sor_005453 [Riccia sorocarpa]|uniref:Uncharacterized protein n=1 Tax=Riccia sorocarpa TaxID=122646 RepID=A0ABD3HJU8_9MARC